MTDKIALTASMRSNLLSLQGTQKLFDKTQDRLSSGYKVNSAMDNPSSYFTAQALNSRANDLSGLLDSIGQAISTLQTADQGITTLQDFVEQAKSIANAARDTSNVQSKATTNSVKFDPDNARTDLLSDYVNVTSGPAPKVITGTETVSADAELVADLGLTAGNITFTLGDNAQDIAVTADDTVQTYIDKVVTAFGADKIKGEVVDGNIKFTTLNNADLKIESARTPETHAARKIDWSGATDISDISAATVDMADTSTTTITLDAGEVASWQSIDVSTAAGQALVASKYAAAFNTAAEAAGYNAVATVDGTVVTIKDMTEGATGTIDASNITATGAPADAAAPNFDIGLVGTSNAELLGLGSGAAGALKASSESVAEPGKSFSLRLGDATKITGTANLRADKTLEEMGMVDGQSIDIIVGEDVHTYTVGKEIDKTSTMQEFMDNIVYDIGRTKVKAELVDGSLSISTLDNSSLSIRSSRQTEDHVATVYSADDIATAAAAGANAPVSLVITPTATGASPVTVDLSGIEGEATAASIAEAINNDAGAKAAGIAAEVNSAGNLAIYDKTIGNADSMTASATLTFATAGAVSPAADGVKSVEMQGTSFNELVGFKPDQTVEVKEGMTVEQFRQAVNNLDGITADFDTKGHLVISGEQGDDLVMVDAAGSNVLKNLYGNDVVSATNGSNERAKYAKQFDDILSQVDQLVQDTSYKGINLLNGDDLTVVFNESRTSTLELKGVTFDSTGLGFTRSANEWISNEDIDKALNQITKATSMLRAQASEFGQNLSTVQIREDFTQNMINNLQTGADKLTLADMNEEAANMLALQTRQQLGVNSLSLASQASQSVLKLF